MKRITIFSLAAVLTAAGISFSACRTTELSVPVDASSREIVQMAQTAWDKNRPQDAEFYYTTLIQRYGMDTTIYVEGTFELAHLYVKEKRYQEALPLLNEVVEIYRNLPPGSLPGAYRKLAEKDLEKIPENLILEAAGQDLPQ